jgi:hypothetical protein
MKITVSGRSYAAACSPEVTSLPQDEGWPEPVRRQMGTKGCQWVYEVDAAMARKIQAHLRDVADEYMATYKDQPHRNIGRGLSHDAFRIRFVLPPER